MIGPKRFPSTWSVKERLEAGSMPIPECGCWIWMRSTRTRGYGCLQINSKTYGTHQLSWTVHHGHIPDGLSVLHKCDTPSCINPDHLFLGTHKINHDDMVKKGRRANFNGEHNGKAVLAEADVIAIRTSPLGLRALAKIYGVGFTAIHKIRARKTWKHVPDADHLAIRV